MKNNAFAAQKVAQDKDTTQAAIASEYAAKVYGLEILEKGVNDLKENSTRFIIVTNQKVFSKDASKISLCFEVPCSFTFDLQWIEHDKDRKPSVDRKKLGIQVFCGF